MGQHVIDFRYRDYLASDDWKQKRQKRLEIDCHECVECGSAKGLQVHHLTYERLYRERMEDLVTLCQECHARLHGHGPKRLRVVGELTPNQRSQQAREARYHDLLAAGRQLNEAIEGFRQQVKGHFGLPDWDYVDDVLFVISWHASEVLDRVRAQWEEAA